MIFKDLILPASKCLGLCSIYITLIILQGCEGDTDTFKEAVFIADNNIESFQIQAINSIIEPNQTQQYSALATITNQAEAEDITSKVTWSSSEPAIASIASSGLVTGNSDGTVIISAKLADLTNTTSLSVSSAELNSITISTNVPSVPVCSNSTQLTANGFYEDSTNRDITESVSWSSADESIATVDNTGKLTALSHGNASITATKNSITSNQLTIAITDTLSDITLSPTDKSLIENDTQSYIATGNYSNGQQTTITEVATWSIADTSGNSTDVATISNDNGSKGVATAAKAGSAIVKASCNALFATTGLTVTEALAVTAVTINDDEETVDVSLSGSDKEVQLTATATLADSSTEDVTEKAAWFVDETVSGTSVTISSEAGSKGLITATAVGETIIKAHYSDITTEITIKVTD